MNRLGKEKSPYLQQHQHNPVDWYPWGEEAFAAARAQKKIIFLSIGYSTCYWCHVMEKDSFEQQDVAAVLNENYISIKVDREEHPEIDEIYMDAVIGMTGRGGWPMTVFLTPDLKPFWGGTYFPRQQFLNILGSLQKFWKEKPEEILDSGSKLTQHLQENNERFDEEKEKEFFSETILDKAYQQIENRFDSRYGGFGGAPKFPPSMTIYFLLREAKAKENAKALSMACETLDAMACGGIHDHLGGGFHRYSTDEFWLVPHFEKMLYDNALLSLAYLEAYQITKKDFYKQIACRTLNYVINHMQDPLGGYYSAEDAGEVGREGEFYVFTHAELEKILSADELIQFKKVYEVTEAGNFEHGNTILHLKTPELWFGRESPVVRSALEKIEMYRGKRTPPHKDKKILTSWNGLMIAAMAKAYQVLGEEKFLISAKLCANFLKSNLWAEQILLRRYAGGEVKYSGTLSDYAYLIWGLINLYEANFEEKYLLWARELQAIQEKDFWDSAHGGYFTASSKEKNLIVRKKDHSDGASPAGNSIAALNHMRLYHFFYQENDWQKAKEIFQCFAADFVRAPSAYAMALAAFEWLVRPVKEIAVLPAVSGAESALPLLTSLQKEFLPRKVLAYTLAHGSEASNIPLLEGKKPDPVSGLVYVCEDRTCLRPVKTLEELQSLL